MFYFNPVRKPESDNDTLVPLPSRALPKPGKYNYIFYSMNSNFLIGRIQTYENSCHMLDITSDWQIRALLSSDTITIMNRSFCFNDIRAFATAIESNLESLTLSSIGLTTRSINVLCQGLNKCVHLTLLVNLRVIEIDILLLLFFILGFII